MNDITLQKYIDMRLKATEDKIDAQSTYIQQHFDLNDRALQKAEDAMLIRLDSMNEFRAQINKERTEYVTKDSLTILLQSMDKRLKHLEEANAFSSGRLWMVMAAFIVAPTAIALVALFL